jgi:sortase (surface protein transpeptidase)
MAFGVLITLLIAPDATYAPIVANASSTTTVAFEKSEPIALRIPKINLEAPFVNPLGLREDGSVEVPDSYTAVGRYKYGPTPGELGPAVIFGHVDSVARPAVFFSLGQLEVGDEIYILREDGNEARFVVEQKRRYLQSEFPTKEVYGDIPYAGLRLITCSGTYKKGEQRYTHNLVIYAKLIE